MSKRRKTSARKTRPADQAPTCPTTTRTTSSATTGPRPAAAPGPVVCPVPVPDPFTGVRLALRPVDPGSGLPYPAMHDQPSPDGEPVPGFLGVFLDTVMRLAYERRCAVCGDQIIDGQYAFLGGPARREPLATIHPPSHEDCLIASLGLCPYLGRRHTRRARGARAEGLTASPGQALGKPETWVLGVTDDYQIVVDEDETLHVLLPGPFHRERRFHYDGSGRLVESVSR